MNKKTETKKTTKKKPVAKKITADIKKLLSPDEVLAIIFKEVNKLFKETEKLKKLKTAPENLKKLRITNKEIKKLKQKYKEAIAAKKAEDTEHQTKIAQKAKLIASSITNSDNRATKDSELALHNAIVLKHWKKKAEDAEFKTDAEAKIRDVVKIIKAKERELIEINNDAKESLKKSPTKPKRRFGDVRNFLFNYLQENNSATFESLWGHIIKNAGTENFLFEKTTKEYAVMEGGKKALKKNIKRQFKRL